MTKKASVKAEWKPVTKAKPCPICESTDWCSRNVCGDAVACKRSSDSPAGWRKIKDSPNGEGAVFAPDDGRKTSEVHRRRGPVDWSSESDRFTVAMTQGRLTALAEKLGVTGDSLRALCIGWAENADLRRLRAGFEGGKPPAAEGAFTFPERDGHGNIIGVSLRTLDGRKGFCKGGKRGLIVPKSFDEMTGVIFVVEGATDTAAALTMGLAAVGRFSNVGGVEFIAEACKGREVLFVGENDRKPKKKWPGKEGAVRSSKNLAARWEKPIRWAMVPTGFKDSRAWINAQNLDLDDAAACEAAGQQLLAALQESAQTVQPPSDATVDKRYMRMPAGLFWLKSIGENFVPVQLTNFDATIVADVLRDDGAEPTHVFEIEARLCHVGAKSHTVSVPAKHFAPMNWVADLLGARALVYPGQSLKDHARAAIQLLSGDDVEHRLTYLHTGWRKRDGGEWVFLHGGGAIGGDGNRVDVETDLHGALVNFVLPDPPTGEELRGAIRATLNLLELGPGRIMFPIVAAVFRSVLGGADFSLALIGRTGVFKTELAALAQQFFGAGFVARRVPGNWTSTENALEGLLFTGKDALIVVDEFTPSGSVNDIASFHRRADRVLRSVGNHQGRGRLSADLTLRPDRPPRGLLLLTGEDIPRGQSLRARMLIIEIEKGDITDDKLTKCQTHAADGFYAKTMSAFLRSLAPAMGEMPAIVKQAVQAIRQQIAKDGQHRRTPDMVAQLQTAVVMFARFAMDTGAITDEERLGLENRAWTALFDASERQAAHSHDADPARRFVGLLGSAIASGLAHVANFDGGAPEYPSRWGWRTVQSGTSYDTRPQGNLIGWTDGTDLYVDGKAAYRVAQNMLGSSDALGVPEPTLRKRMNEIGLLQSRDEARETLTIRRTLQGANRNVLHLRADAIDAPEGAFCRVSLSGFEGVDGKPDKNQERSEAPVCASCGGLDANCRECRVCQVFTTPERHSIASDDVPADVQARMDDQLAAEFEAEMRNTDGWGGL